MEPDDREVAEEAWAAADAAWQDTAMAGEVLAEVAEAAREVEKEAWAARSAAWKVLRSLRERELADEEVHRGT